MGTKSQQEIQQCADTHVWLPTDSLLAPPQCLPEPRPQHPTCQIIFSLSLCMPAAFQVRLVQPHGADGKQGEAHGSASPLGERRHQLQHCRRGGGWEWEGAYARVRQCRRRGHVNAWLH